MSVFLPVHRAVLACLIVMAGLQSFSSSRMDRHTVPEGYTLGWKIGGSNLPESRRIQKKSSKLSSANINKITQK